MTMDTPAALRAAVVTADVAARYRVIGPEYL
jgi:hypothetical protein